MSHFEANSEVSKHLKKIIRNVPDFPKKGINFKDITTIFLNPKLNRLVEDELTISAQKLVPDVILGIDSRGFIYGNSVANKIGIPFAMVRKKGKLPYDAVSESYALEYGEAQVELHKDAIKKDQKVLIHDDLLATGGTAIAAAKLVEKLGGKVIGFQFIIELNGLGGREKLLPYSNNIINLVSYT